MKEKWATLNRKEKSVIVLGCVLFSPALLIVGIVLFVYTGWVYLWETLEWLLE